MSAIYTVDQTLQVNDYYAKVIKIKAHKNVIQSILKRGETSPGASGMQPRDPFRPWRGTLASGHKPR